MNNLFSTSKKQIALLIDPDKISAASFPNLIQSAQSAAIDIILVGGSLLLNDISQVILQIKNHCSIPVYIFPGNSSQFSAHADGILFLSLISGRNPEYLIGNHITSAYNIKKSGIDVVPVGYILIDGGKPTSVEYISNTRPIPYEKNDIAVSTAIAGQLLGMKAIYLEGGSGSARNVSTEMIKLVKSNLDITLIVGGGIKSPQILKSVFDAGADIAVIGTAIENDNSLLDEFVKVRNFFNS